MRGQRGITLVALVVTIVVLLILAGITITYVLSDGGIFGKAQEAAKETILAEMRDHVSTALLTTKMDAVIAASKNATFSNAEAKASLEAAMPTTGKYGASTATLTTASKDNLAGTMTVLYDSKTYTVTITSYTEFSIAAPEA